MTAQVAVLNTEGVALASDSTVTITGGAAPRSYQSADKIFPIKGEPLAVLHSGAASFCGVPWQILIEMWSQDRSCGLHTSMEAYAQEFVDWLGSQSTLLTEDELDQYFQWMFRDVLLALRVMIRQKMSEEGYESFTGHAEGAVATIVRDVTQGFVAKLEAAEAYEGLEKFDGLGLYHRLEDTLMEVFEWVFDDTPRTDFLEQELANIGSLLGTKVEPFEKDAVLAFVGYTAEEFSPASIA